MATAQRVGDAFGLVEVDQVGEGLFWLQGLATNVSLSARYVLPRPAHDVAGAHGTGLAGHFTAIDKQRQGQNAADLVAGTIACCASVSTFATRTPGSSRAAACM